jgi:hypothetical protein
VANDKRRRGSGRVTPRAGQEKPAPAGKSRARLPGRIGPFERPNAEGPLGQVGRRPSSPFKLLAFAAMYVACGIIALIALKGSLRIILGVVFIGVGLLWLRGAATAALRQQRRTDDDG